jgi:DNA invertase Pin-like site-specific DNA recombinase
MAKRVVQTIPALFMDARDDVSTKLRVAAYARVSTEKEEQEDSFERQVEHYKQMILARSDWMYVGIYADPGLSGTRAEKRPDFLRMIADCRAGKIQKILVKSISRFARNTVDALQYIRELKELGISVYFESENIDTLTPGGEVLLTILAAMAEQESRTISSNIKWAWQRKWQAGEVNINTGMMLGYRKAGKDENGHNVYEICETEAEIVRRVYREYISGLSIRAIGRNLEAEGIKTKLGRSKWTYRVIESILQNEKYTGDAILGKTYKPDVLSPKRVKNDGSKSPLYYVEDSHPAIIEKSMFELAKKERLRRQESSSNAVGGGRYSSKYPFSGLLECGICGHKLRRHVRTVGTGKKVAYWCCTYRQENTRAACDSHHVREDVLEATYLEAMRTAMGTASEVTDAIRSAADSMMTADKQAALAQIEADILSIQASVLDLHKARQRLEIGQAEYAAKIAEYSAAMKAKDNERDKLQDNAMKYAEVKTWLAAFDESISTGRILTANDSAIMHSLIERIVVKDDGIEVYLRCGVCIGQEYVNRA